MSVYDLLTDNDKTLIEKYIKFYGPLTEEDMDWSRYEGLETVLQEWATNKDKQLNKLFDNHLILTRPYTYIAQADALSKSIDKKLYADTEAYMFICWFSKIKHTAGNDLIIDYLNTPQFEAYSKWFWIDYCLEPLTLASNSYDGENIKITFPSGHIMKVFKGMKPMKILHKVAEEFDCPEDVFEAFRIWHSKQLNQKKFDGRLCLSIHPLDFMTMSDNENGWTSCMRWKPTSNNDSHGDFRGGTVSCMNSPYIIIAYLHNPEHTYQIDTDCFWNSKQWRELFIVQEGIITEIKAYPFQDENLTNTCLMWIKELAENNLGWTYENEEINTISEIPNEDNAPILLSFTPGPFMYKDMGTLGFHRGRINKSVLLGKYNSEVYFKNSEKDVPWQKFININYGGIPTCMCCGEEIIDVDATNVVICQKCDAVRRCPLCGQAIFNSYDCYYIEEYDDPVCTECWENECAYDNFSGESHCISNMVDISVLLGYDEDHNPIFLDRTAWCYDPEENFDYQKIFNAPPIDKDYQTYVTLDMINPGWENVFMETFEVFYRQKFETLKEDYNVIYPV